MQTDIVKRVDDKFVLYVEMNDPGAGVNKDYIKRWVSVGVYESAKEASNASKKYN